MEKILILSPGPFSKRDYDRFGIDYLKKNFSVRIIDLTAWLYPNFWKEISNKILKLEDCETISNKNDFLKFNTDNDPIIVLDFIEKNTKTNWVRSQLKKRKCLFIGFDINLIPQDSFNILKSFKKHNFKKLPIKIISVLINFFLQKYYNFNKKYLPQILVVGGLSSSRKFKIKRKIYAHCMDYDVYLKIKNKTKENHNYDRPYAVFLDEDMCNHPDYIFQNINIPVSENEYYPILINFFKRFELLTGLKIKFAAHPKSRTRNLDKLLKNFDCSVGNTPELIKNSKAVILHASTSVSYAILFKKPALFLTSNELKNSWIGPRISNFVRNTNGKLINLSNNFDNELSTQDLFTVDKIQYQKYLEKYLKTPNSPEIPLWEIFTKDIKNTFREN